MEGSIHHDKHGWKVHLRGKWFRRVKINEKWVSFKHNRQSAEDALVLMNGDIIRGNKYDPRDWTSDEPLSFKNVTEEWLDCRKKDVRAYRLLSNHIERAKDFFGNRNLKTIRFKELDTLVKSLPETLSAKTKRNILATLHSFFKWVIDQELDTPNPMIMPRFPKIPYEKPPMPKILSPEDQAKVLGILAQQKPYKIYIAALWCITYGLRWEEVRQIKGNDFDNGYMTVWDWKQKHYKRKKLLKEDWDTVKRDKLFGNEYFFRHNSGRQYGKDFLYERIRKTLKTLGFYGVKAYAVIRHSTITALSEFYTPEEIQKLFSLHLSDSVWHYLHYDDDKKQEMYARARGKIGEIKAESVND